MRKTLRACLTVGVIVAGGACSDGSSNGGGGGGPTTTTWAGLVQGSDGIESGGISITVQTASPRIVGPGTGIVLAAGDVAASGTYKRTAPTAASVPLTGTYNSGTKALDVSGSGYAFTGVFDGSSRLEGTFTGPTTNGTFVSEKNTGSAKVYCGTYTGTTDNGTWSIVVQGTEVHGQAVSSVDGTRISLDGVVSGTTITIYFAGTTTTLASGTISGNSASGTWDNQDTDSGTWTGSTSCQ
jgi:hypothetical protein